eukprot:gene13211-19046_t
MGSNALSDFYASLDKLSPSVPKWSGDQNEGLGGGQQAPHQTDAGAARPSVPPISFRTSGVHQLGAYRPPPEAANAPKFKHPNVVAGQTLHNERNEPVLAAASSGMSTSGLHRPVDSSHALPLEGQVASSNIGYKLLKRVGWQHGTGLGASEQGRTVPIQAWQQKGSVGIGFDKKRKHGEGGNGRHSKGSTEDGGRGASSKAVRMSAKKRVDQVIAAEFEGETLDAKVKRHRQVLKQEAIEEKDKAIQRAVYDAFNDPFDSVDNGDTNPIGRSHRLTKTNPLLDDSD